MNVYRNFLHTQRLALSLPKTTGEVKENCVKTTKIFRNGFDETECVFGVNNLWSFAKRSVCLGISLSPLMARCKFVIRQKPFFNSIIRQWIFFCSFIPRSKQKKAHTTVAIRGVYFWGWQKVICCVFVWNLRQIVDETNIWTRFARPFLSDKWMHFFTSQRVWLMQIMWFLRLFFFFFAGFGFQCRLLSRWCLCISCYIISLSLQRSDPSLSAAHAAVAIALAKRGVCVFFTLSFFRFVIAIIANNWPYIRFLRLSNPVNWFFAHCVCTM